LSLLWLDALTVVVMFDLVEEVVVAVVWYWCWICWCPLVVEGGRTRGTLAESQNKKSTWSCDFSNDHVFFLKSASHSSPPSTNHMTISFCCCNFRCSRDSRPSFLYHLAHPANQQTANALHTDEGWWKGWPKRHCLMSFWLSVCLFFALVNFLLTTLLCTQRQRHSNGKGRMNAEQGTGQEARYSRGGGRKKKNGPRDVEVFWAKSEFFFPQFFFSSRTLFTR
jgi:hypothetical protein